MPIFEIYQQPCFIVVQLTSYHNLRYVYYCVINNYAKLKITIDVATIFSKTARKIIMPIFESTSPVLLWYN